MDPSFSPSPNQAAIALLINKKPVASDIFQKLLPELKARAFAISGINFANVLQASRDAVAALPLGGENGLTWDQAQKEIADQLQPYLGDGAQPRADLILRVNSYQAFNASLYQTAQADDDTTHLQYLHGECKVPTPSHLALNGLILPKNDPFWKTHTPPWGHLGCVCSFRPMNPDLVDDQRQEDKKRNPDSRLVLEGPALRALQHGDLIRDGRHYNVASPENSGFSWHPDDLKIPLKDLAARYDPEVWSEFQHYAQSTKLNDKTGQSLWDWLNSTELAVPPKITRAVKPSFSGPALSRLDAD